MEVLLVLAGALPTIIVSILTNKSVINNARQATAHKIAVGLREKQIEVINELSGALVKLIGVSSIMGEDILGNLEEILVEDEKKRTILSFLEEANSIIMDIYPKALLLLPSAITNSLGKLISAIATMQGNQTSSNFNSCSESALELLNLIREFIGIDRLSKTLDTIYLDN